MAEIFDPNTMSDGSISKTLVPSIPAMLQGFISTIDEYSAALVKSLDPPPSALSFAQISYMPDVSNSGLLPWPGIDPSSLRKVARESIAPKLIINMRVLDVMRYSALSKHEWRPGWSMELMTASANPTDEQRQDMEDAESFLLNCNNETDYENARARDQGRLTDLQRFLSATVRDTFTYDGVAVWTDMDNAGRIKSFASLPGGNIRLTGPDGYKGDLSIFAVMLDEAATVKQVFTRDQLIWYVRNPRTDPEVGGYGNPELGECIKLIQGFENAVDMNVGTFTKSGIPNGMMLLKGDMVNQKVIDLLAREWQNLKRGITKVWSLPAMAIPEGTEIEVLDLSAIKGEDVRYQDYMNMLIGATCTIFGFPVRRLGYRASGKGPDTAPLPDTSMDLVDEDDPGLAPLLMHLENLINSYLIWPRWPKLRFQFSGKNPKEDAREYEAKRNALTWAEARARADLPTLESLAPPHLKELAEIMALAPIDPNLGGVFQGIMAAFVKGEGAAEGGDAPQKGNSMTSKRDPAKSESHGHASGVRRDSKAESR
jgi:hypothetical protein